MNRILWLSLILIISSCKEDNNDPPVVVEQIQFEDDPAGEWFAGDFHVHATGASNDTGGDSYPIDIKNKALEIGLDFVILTDHSNSTGSDPSTTDEDPALFNQGPEFPYWDRTLELSDENEFLMICGNEISPVAEEYLMIPTGHIGCIPREFVDFDRDSPFIDRPKGAVSGGEALQQANDRGCFAIVNHPYNLVPWIQYDWTNMDYDAIEIWNGTLGYDIYDEASRKIWICDLLHGKNTIPIASSDCHRVNTEIPGSGTNPALGYPSTAVFAETLDWTAIMNGLEEGMVCLFEGESRLHIDTYNADGRRNNTPDFDIIRLRGKADINLINPVLKLTHTTGCVDPRPSSDFPDLVEDIAMEEPIIAGEDFDINIEVPPNSGVYNATLFGDFGRYGAISRAIVVE